MQSNSNTPIQVNVNTLNSSLNFAFSSFPCYYTNIQSIGNKFNEFVDSVTCSKPLVIGITETWLNSDVRDAEIDLNDYELFRCDRVDGKGGGSLLYVHNCFQTLDCNEINDIGFQESVWRIVNLNQENKLLVGVVYRSPSSNQINDDKLLQTFQKVVNIKGITHILIMGDFNMPDIKWNSMYVQGNSDTLYSRFFDLTQDLFLYQHTMEHTRFRIDQEPSLLDLLFTNDEMMISDIKYEQPIGKSDHVVLKFDFHCGELLGTEHTSSFSKPMWHKADFNSLDIFFNSVDWSRDLQDLDVESSWTKFKTVIEEGVTKFVPYKDTNTDNKRDKQPWFRKKVKDAVRLKSVLFKKYRRTKRYVDKLEYIKQRNITNEVIWKAKRDYESDIMKSIKTHPKRFYSYVRDKQKVKVKVTSLDKGNGNFTKNDSECCQVLSDFFSSVFTKEGDTELPDFQSRTEFVKNDIVITEEKVFKKLCNLKTDKSQGPDSINPRLLKECRNSLAKPLTVIFQKSIESGILPRDFKHAIVTPIFKKGCRSSPGNYRPVSLTSIPCKILESIIRDEMLDHLESNKLLSDNQHGFTSHRSCLTNLLETLEEITSQLDNGEGIDIVFLDYRKAFDSVPHRRLIYKLSKYGFGETFTRWITNFLCNRTQTVSLRGTFSQPSDVLSGVPQGSVLGPLLFILYVNEIPELIQGTAKLFADDTKVFDKASKKVILQRDLDILYTWSSEWLLKFNESKCKVMHVGRNNPRHDYKIGNTTLEKVSEECDLGVYLTEDLKPSLQCVKAAKKASSALGIVKRTFSTFDISSFALLYKTYVRCHMEYCVQAWCPYYRKDIEILEKIQKRATRMVPELKNLSYSERLKHLGLTSLEDRRKRGDLIEAYKIITGKEKVQCNKFFKLVDSDNNRTRGNSMKIYKPRLNKCILQRTNFFSVRVVNAWNSLPEDVISAKTVNTFKNRLDKFLQTRHGAQEASPIITPH
ncbi:MAG: reverse transcriptase family protein [Candidatus Thiodiazotropha sp.]